MFVFIFILSGVLVKYNLWFSNLSSNPETSKKTIISPVDQKSIIHTLVDLLNSILEINIHKNKNYIYEMFASRFFSKLNQVYSGTASKELLDRLDNSIKMKITVSSDKKIHYKTSKNIVNTILNGRFVSTDFGSFIWPIIKPINIITKLKLKYCVIVSKS